MINRLDQSTSELSTLSHAQIRWINQKWTGCPDLPDCALVPFLNRPFIHHVVDDLVAKGSRRLEFIGSDRDDSLRAVLGAGERWGVEFSFRSTDVDSEPNDLDDMQCPRIAAHTLPFASESNSGGAVTRTDTPENYLAAQKKVMSDDLASRVTIESEVSEGVWVGRNVSIHSSAIIEGPVLIGENTRISAGARLGPHVVIGSNCLIDRGTSIVESTVFANVYVGEGLDLRDSIATSRRILNTRLGTNLAVKDDMLVGRFPW